MVALTINGLKVGACLSLAGQNDAIQLKAQNLESIGFACFWNIVGLSLLHESDAKMLPKLLTAIPEDPAPYVGYGVGTMSGTVPDRTSVRRRYGVGTVPGTASIRRRYGVGTASGTAPVRCRYGVGTMSARCRYVVGTVSVRYTSSPEHTAGVFGACHQQLSWSGSSAAAGPAASWNFRCPRRRSFWKAMGTSAALVQSVLVCSSSRSKIAPTPVGRSREELF